MAESKELKRVMICLSEGFLTRLDEVSTHYGMSRSAYIRGMIAEKYTLYLKEQNNYVSSV